MTGTTLLRPNTPDRPALTLADDLHDALVAERGDGLGKLGVVDGYGALPLELADGRAPPDAAGASGVRELDDLTLKVGALAARRCARACRDEIEVDLARERVGGGLAEGGADEAVRLAHVLELDHGAETHARVRLREADHALELAGRGRDAALLAARVLARLAHLDVCRD